MFSNQKYGELQLWPPGNSQIEMGIVFLEVCLQVIQIYLPCFFTDVVKNNLAMKAITASELLLHQALAVLGIANFVQDFGKDVKYFSGHGCLLRTNYLFRINNR